MKILFDYQAFEMQKFGGVSRIFFELLCRSKKDNNMNWALPIKYSTNEYLKNVPGFENQLVPKPDPYKEFLGGKKFKGKSRLYNIKNKFSPPEDLTDFNKKLSIQEIQKSEFDIFHPTYYDEYFMQHIGSKPFVATVYDMIHEIYPEYLFNDPVIRSKRILLDKAAKIIAISENTKKDLISFFSVPEDKIEVVYLGNSMDNPVVSKSASIEMELPEKYLLYVGNRRIYKNFYFFLNSILPVLQQDPSIHIVCTGLSFDEHEIGFFHSLTIYERIHHRYVDDLSLSYLYKNAIAFVFPSLYEGFGLPVLEAFSCKCPVALSNTSSLPEVGGDAAIYFDPKNPISIREAIVKVLYDKELRKELVIKGSKRLELFSWQKMYDKTLEVYNKVLSK